jgi:creatinine amidohydrolase
MQILTAANTAFELEEQKPGLAFLPIGATEQHSRHLPLCTDTMLADALSTEVLCALDWPGAVYLLPTLPVSSSAENTGYRGTVSFTPLTMRAIIRDAYHSLAAAGFPQLIVCPWHAGNFIVKPVVRELNHELGRCGVFYVNPWEHIPADVLAQFGPGFDIHSGDFETSLMLAIDPTVVRDERVDNPGPERVSPAWLDMWSLKTLSGGEGHVGRPTRATVEKGRALRQSVVAHTAGYLRQLLEMSGRYDRY